MVDSAYSEFEALIVDIASRLPNSRTVISDALFGYKYIKPYLESLKEGTVLEVGAGPCILLSHIKSHYPGLKVVGIEPISAGFGKSREAVDLLKAICKLDLFQCGYEDFSSTELFDLIFLVNVFEHLPNWKHFLAFVEQRLKREGKCVVLCPNYGFPYESHFSLPIILNKSATQFLFKKRIAKRELRDGSHGLWESLNFVSLGKISKELGNLNLDMVSHRSILDDQIQRLRYDKEFLKRHRIIAVFARVLSYVRITNVFRLRFFQRFQPYLFLEFTLKSGRH
jgi:SAM-dependent methyltransferase